MAAIGFYEALSLIKQNHPDIFYLLSKPGVLKVALDMVQAEADGKPWTSAQIDAAFSSTPYFLNTNLATRQWDVLRATDPASAGTKAEMTKRLVQQAEAQTGLRLNDTDSFAFFVNAVKNGWDAQEIKYRLLASVNTRGGAGGELGSQASTVKQMANDMGVPLSDQSVMSYARQMLEGNLDQNGLQGYLKEQALSLFPSLKTALDQGQTVRQYVAPYLQIAQQEVGINPANVNLTDQKWLNILNQVDPKTGARVSMSLDQALKTFRSDPAWGYDQTNKAHQDATQLATALQQKFGAAA